MELLPAIDLRQGQVVRLCQGDDARRTVYDVEPGEVLLRYGRAGAGWVHVVDLDGAMGEGLQRELLESLVRTPDGPKVQLGGGLRERSAVEWALEVGCERVVLTSLMVRDFDLFRQLVEEYPGRIVPALDLASGQLRTSGWREAATAAIEELCSRLRQLAIPAVLVTDIARDGTLAGPNLELARELSGACGAPVLLSGGIRSVDDLAAARSVPEIAGAVVGRALYDGTLKLEEALAVCLDEESRP